MLLSPPSPHYQKNMTGGNGLTRVVVRASPSTESEEQTSCRTDAYGFIISESMTRTRMLQARKWQQIRIGNERSLKWRRMLSNWDTFVDTQPATLKRRIRRGIPQQFRGHVWQRLVDCERQGRESNEYTSLLLKETQSAKSILLDIHRTFPTHQLFRNVQGVGQRSLFNVLRAYSIHDRTIVYCQGMGFVTGLFLCYMPEREAFWMLEAVIRRFKMAGIFTAPFVRLNHLFRNLERLLESRLPDLAMHLQTIGMRTDAYATQWFMTIFLYSFPFEVVARIWDVFLAEGWSFLLRVALALLKMAERYMLQQSLGACMNCLKQLPKEVNPEKVMQVALSIRMTKEEIEALEAEETY